MKNNFDIEKHRAEAKRLTEENLPDLTARTKKVLSKYTVKTKLTEKEFDEILKQDRPFADNLQTILDRLKEDGFTSFNFSLDREKKLSKKEAEDGIVSQLRYFLYANINWKDVSKDLTNIQ